MCVCVTFTNNMGIPTSCFCKFWGRYTFVLIFHYRASKSNRKVVRPSKVSWCHRKKEKKSERKVSREQGTRRDRLRKCEFCPAPIRNIQELSLTKAYPQLWRKRTGSACEHSGAWILVLTLFRGLNGLSGGLLVYFALTNRGFSTG